MSLTILTPGELALKIGELPNEIKSKMRAEVLPKAGEIMEQYQVGTIQSKDLVETGQMRDAVRSKVLENRVNVAPIGKRTEGVRVYKKKRGKRDWGTEMNRNSGVAFVVHYGEKNINKRGKGWVDDANAAAEDAVFALAAEAFGRILDEEV